MRAERERAVVSSLELASHAPWDAADLPGEMSECVDLEETTEHASLV